MEFDQDDNTESNDEIQMNRSEVGPEEDVIYLSLFHGASKLGASYYNVADGILYVMNDMADLAPHFKLVLTVTAQLNPKHLLICSRHNEAFAKAAKEQMSSESTVEDSSLATETRWIVFNNSFRRSLKSQALWFCNLENFWKTFDLSIMIFRC